MENERKTPPSRGEDKRPKSSIFVTLIIAVAIVLVISLVYNAIVGSQYTQTTYSDFLTALEEDNLADVQLQYDRILYLTKEEAEKPANEQKACFTGLPNGDALALERELEMDAGQLPAAVREELAMGVGFDTAEEMEMWLESVES